MKNQREILELTNTLTERIGGKTPQWMSSTAEWKREKKESVNLKVNNRNDQYEQQRESRLKKKVSKL